MGKRRHTLRTGFEFRHHDFPYRGWAVGNVAGEFAFDRVGTTGFDASGNSVGGTGDAFASFLLGQVHTAGQALPAFPTFRETYTGLWINDELKVSDRLTLTLGLRFDYVSSRTEVSDQVPRPSVRPRRIRGAGGRPGAIVFAGTGPGRAGTRKFDDVPRDAGGHASGS